MQIGQPFIPFRLFVGSFLPNNLMAYPGLTATSKILWSRLSQYAGQDGECYPSQASMAISLGTTEKQIRLSIKELVRMGFLAVIQPSGKERLLHKTIRYQFLWHEIFEDSRRGQNDRSGGVKMTGPEGSNLPVVTVVRESLVKQDYSRSYPQGDESKDQEAVKETIPEPGKNVLASPPIPPPPPSPRFDSEKAFESIWEIYPDKSGKKASFRHFAASVENDQDLESIRKALDNYLASKRVENGYIQNGSTWFNNWRDWISPTEHQMGNFKIGSKEKIPWEVQANLLIQKERLRKSSMNASDCSDTTKGTGLSNGRST